MQFKRILIDLDDVLNNFTMAALEYIGCPVGEDDFHLYDPKWGYDIVHAANKLHPTKLYMSNREFWKELSVSFWENILASDIMFPLLEVCSDAVGYDRICILTAPVIYSPEVATLKIRWMDRNLPSWMYGQFIISRHKHFCAHPEALLIDDHEKNIIAFREYGGHAILVPRPWNSLHTQTSDALQYVLLELERML